MTASQHAVRWRGRPKLQWTPLMMTEIPLLARALWIRRHMLHRGRWLRIRPEPFSEPQAGLIAASRRSPTMPATARAVTGSSTLPRQGSLR